MNGNELLQTICALPPESAAAAIMRHAERFPIADPADPTLAEITPRGAAAAEAFGARITGFDCVRIFHSPIKRCQQTAECIARGVASAGLAVDFDGPQAILGIDYIRDLVEVGRLSVQHSNAFVRHWFAGEFPETVIQPATQIAASKLDWITGRLSDPGVRGRRLDLHVSHDWNVIVLRELMLGVCHEDTGWLTFLDGIAFSVGTAGLRAVYRDRVVEQPLPWRFALVDQWGATQTPLRKASPAGAD